MSKWHKVELQKLGDYERGFLTPAEAERSIPFAIKRVYTIYGVPSHAVERGHHAHRRVEQVFICLAGSVIFELQDEEQSEELQLLGQPQEGLYIGSGVWHVMRKFTRNAIVLALASDYHDEGEYVKDYDEWKRLVAQ